jgi:hypothetical protein
MVGSASSRDEEGLLAFSLLLQIGLGEVGGSDGISKHELVVFINNSTDYRFSPQSLIEGSRVFLGIDDLSLNRIEDVLYLSDQYLRNSVQSKRMDKMSPCCIKLLPADFEFPMGCFHISAFVVIGTASYQRYKAFLTFPLLGHVGIGEIVVNYWVLHHELIKLINN